MNQTVLFIRHGSMGDVLLSFPIIDRYKKDHPEKEIHFLTEFITVAEGNPNISICIDSRKMSLDDCLLKYPEVYFLYYEEYPKLHIVDGYKISTGLPCDDKKIQYHIGEKDKTIANRFLKKTPLGKKLVGIQVSCGHKLRNYPIQKFQTLIDSIKKTGDYEVIAFSDNKEELHNCINLTAEIPDVRVVAALISNCNYFISIDSGLLHFAQAFGVPLLAIFGCTYPELRVTDPESIRVVVNSKLDCLGCYHRIPTGQETLKDCHRGDHACMEDLLPETILQEFELLEKNVPYLHLKEKMRITNQHFQEFLKSHNSGTEKESAEKLYRDMLIKRKSLGFMSSKIASIFQLLFKGDFKRLFFIIRRKLL